MSQQNNLQRNRVSELSGAVTNALHYFLIDRFQYCHVIDKDSGAISLHEGPKRLQLKSHEELLGELRSKVRLAEGEYAIVRNPFSPQEDDILEGQKEVRVGPTVFSLHPGEILDGGVQQEHVLTTDDALLLRAEKDAPHPLNESDTFVAGEEILLKGPRRYIPHKDVSIREHRHSTSLAEAEGVYIQDDDTGEVRLVIGPDDFFLEHNQSFWSKRLTEEELQALGYRPQVGLDGESRILSCSPRPRRHNHDAVVVELEHNEAICLYDGDKTRVEFGPKTVYLGPTEHPKVLFISGGVPVKPNALRLTKLSLGPDFIRDRLSVRTRDNATLELEVTFRWRFRVDESAPEKLFSLKDFVGFTAQTLSSEIREEAAKHDFEAFHSKAAELVKKAIFAEEKSRIFEENGLEIFGVDVEGISHEDQEIQRKLTDALKTNVDIFTRRAQEQAQLDSERRLIDGRKENEEARKELIEKEIGNETAKLLAQARATAEAERIRAESKAEALRIEATAAREVEELRLKSLTAILSSDGGKAYIELERARVLRETDKVIVPTDSRLHLGSHSLIEE